MALFQNTTFGTDDTTSEVEVDGNTYQGCSFKNCMFVYRGGPPPRFSHCSFDNPNFRFADAAANTLDFMTALFHSPFRKNMEQTFKNIRIKKPTIPIEVGH